MMYSGNELRERKGTRKQNRPRETIPDSVKTAMPASSVSRRYSEDKLVSRPLSRHGNRPLSSKSLDNDEMLRAQEVAKVSEERSLLYKRGQQEGRNLSRHQSSEFEELVSSHGAPFVPRPPSRQRTEGRPISAKGRIRPSSQVGVENKASGGGSAQVSLHPPPKPQLSFSKYPPLPSIGTGLLPEPGSYHVFGESLLKGTDISSNNDVDYSNHLSQRTAGLSIQHTLPNEPSEEEPGRIHLAVKLLDGSRHERWFRNTETLGTVMAFAASISNDELPPCQFCTNEVPRKVFDNLSFSLAEAGIHSRTVLHLEDKVE